MPRPPRQHSKGIYHVAAHGSDQRELFTDDRDRIDFIEQLGLTWWQLGVELLAYTLMGNHYHAIARIPDARLSEALQRLHTRYSRHHNRIHGRKAHLFRAHCLTTRIRDDAHLLTVYRYIARNPVRAGLVLDPLDWPWGSARAHAGLEEPRIPLQQNPLRDALGGGRDWRQRYVDLILGDTNDEAGLSPGLAHYEFA